MTRLLAAATVLCLSALGAKHLMSAPFEPSRSAASLAAAVGAAFLVAGGTIGAPIRHGWEQRTWHRPSTAWRALPLGLVLLAAFDALVIG